MADKALNSGACFTDYSGSIKREVPQLTGCCIDTERGVLKVTDIDKKQYPPVLSILPMVFTIYMIISFFTAICSRMLDCA